MMSYHFLYNTELYFYSIHVIWLYLPPISDLQFLPDFPNTCCSGLNEYGPHRLMYLRFQKPTAFPVSMVFHTLILDPSSPLFLLHSFLWIIYKFLATITAKPPWQLQCPPVMKVMDCNYPWELWTPKFNGFFSRMPWSWCSVTSVGK